MAILDDVSSRVTIHHGHLDGRSPGAPSAPGLGPPRHGPGAAGAGGAGGGAEKRQEGGARRWRRLAVTIWLFHVAMGNHHFNR